MELLDERLESDTSQKDASANTPLPAWLKVSAIAAASALLGGMAAAWFYRKTVSRLQNSEPHAENTDFRRNEAPMEDEA